MQTYTVKPEGINLLRKRMLIFSAVFSVLVIAAVLSGCSIREINLSGIENPGPDSVSYLLVDKNPDYQAKVMIFVEGIDDIKLDLINDPCVYLIKQGSHTFVFTARDFNSGSSIDTKYNLEATSQSGKYYQVVPHRKDDALFFEFEEIDPGKVDQINRREIKSLIGFLFSGG